MFDDPTFKSIGESLAYPTCNYCKKRIRSGVGLYKGFLYHIITNETGEPCEADESCLAQGVALDKLREKHNGQDIL